MREMKIDSPLLNGRYCAADVGFGAHEDNWPNHLLTPGPLGWAWWKDAVLRSAGFPAKAVRRLSNPELARLADEASNAEAAFRCNLESTEAVLRQQIMTLRSKGADDHRAELRRIGRTQKALRTLAANGKIDAAIEGLPAILVEKVRSAAIYRDSAFSALRYAFSDVSTKQIQITRTFAQDPKFRSAVAWQNLEAVQTVLDALAFEKPMSGSKRKQRESLVASYVQRYCTKNDTIGFFGPMAWIRIDDSPTDAKFEIGSRLIRSRSVHFEDWAIESLAQQFASNDRYLPWLVAYRQPFLRVERNTLYLPGGTAIELSAGAAQLLRCCNGVLTVEDLVKAELADPFGSFTTKEAVFAELRALERLQRLRLAFPIPSCQDDPDQPLYRCFDKISDPGLRGDALRALDRLIAGKAAILEAADYPDGLLTALNNLHQQFRDVVGGESRRRLGEVYGGRALVYEDCHRDVTITIPPQVLNSTFQALELVMTSARWLTTAAGERFESAFNAEFDRICVDSRRDSVSLPDFWLRIQSIVFGDHLPIDDLAEVLRDRWERILLSAASPGQTRVNMTVADIRDRVRDEFRSDSGSSWTLSRYQCPDLMFCAKSPQHLLSGEYLAVLGEVHVGGNTVATNLFASQHPDRHQLLKNIARDLGNAYVMPKLSPEASGTPTRTQWIDDSKEALEIIFSGGFVPANPHTAMSTADLLVVRDRHGLIVRHKINGWESTLTNALGDFLFLAVINHFGILHKRAHAPRVTIDSLVVHRESWTFSAEDLPFVREPDECDLFRMAREWKNSRCLPDTAFLKMAWEAKPVYIDFFSIISIRMLAKQVRNALDDFAANSRKLTFSEVLPAFNELWLADSEGNHFTSELRLVAIHERDIVQAER